MIRTAARRMAATTRLRYDNFVGNKNYCGGHPGAGLKHARSDPRTYPHDSGIDLSRIRNAAAREVLRKSLMLDAILIVLTFAFFFLLDRYAVASEHI
jgi:hypothetical protein